MSTSNTNVIDTNDYNFFKNNSILFVNCIYIKVNIISEMFRHNKLILTMKQYDGFIFSLH